MKEDCTFSPLPLARQTAAPVIPIKLPAVYVDNKVIHLTAIEYKLLCLLAKNIGKLLTHNHIKQKIWMDDKECDSQLSLRVFVINLRKKLNASDYIITHIGIGCIMINISNNEETP